MTEPLLEVRGLRARFADAEVLHGLDLRLERGEVLFLLGPNGAGKSTFLRCLAGRVRGKGLIRFADEDLLPLSTRERIRRGLVLCPEGRRLFPDLTIEENLLLGGHLRRDRQALARDLRALGDRIPWLHSRLRQAAGTLSGGEQQMVAVARALLARPRLLLLDEPTVGLSAAAIGQLQRWLELQCRDYGVTILGTEQNVVFAREIATRCAIFTGGRIETIVDAESPRPEGGGATLAARLFSAGVSGIDPNPPPGEQEH